MIAPYNIQHIAGILKSNAVLTDPSYVIEQLLTDSRRLVFPATTLFFALKTEKRDGHVFIADLYERGVENFVVAPGFDAPLFPKANFIFVNNALQALQELAAYHRSRFLYPVLGITGSNGKTIVKEWLFQLLAADHHIVRNPRSYNSQTGVPLSVWLMRNTHNLALFEAGISMPGEMEALEKIIRPTVGIFTSLGEAHQQNFDTLLQKAKEKCKLFVHAEVIVYPADNETIRLAIEEILPGKKCFSWGKNGKAEVQIIDVKKNQASTSIYLKYKNNTHIFQIPFGDDASIHNCLTCITVLIYLNIPVAEIQEKILSLQSLDMRLQLMQSVNNCTLINDSYSFDISSLAIALDFQDQQKQLQQKTVILSDLPANHDGSVYTEVVTMLQAKNIHRFITIGTQWIQYAELIKKNVPVSESFSSTEEFIHFFSVNHFRAENILLKGARSFAFEKIVALLSGKTHHTVLEINLTAMAHNLSHYRERLQKSIKIMVMVKAFGYGSGSAEVAKLLQFHKADYLGVAYADEGVDLRKAGLNLPIMVMNAAAEDFENIIQYNLEPEIYSVSIFKAFSSFIAKQGLLQYPVHIKIDTGMHRLGFEEKDMPPLSLLLKNNSYVVVRSVFSHLAASDDSNEDAFTMQQAAVFDQCCNVIQRSVGYTFLKHIANTAAIFKHIKLQYDMVRLGIGLYGIENSSTAQLALLPVSTLKTAIAQLRKVKAGDTIGYNRRGLVEKDSMIATISIGYADGFSRKLGNGAGKVFIHDAEAPVIGNVCMDMTMVDVTHIPQVQEGDEVEIFGNHISVQQMAAWCGTIPYEILTGISQRVKRIYSEE